MLPYAIKKLQAAGYRLVSLSECLGGVPRYQRTQTPGTRDVSYQMIFIKFCFNDLVSLLSRHGCADRTLSVLFPFIL